MTTESFMDFGYFTVKGYRGSVKMLCGVVVRSTEVEVKGSGQECPLHTMHSRLSANRRLCGGFSHEDDFRLEERSGHAAGDGDQVPLSAEHFDESRLREFREIYGPAVANASSGGF